MFECDNHIIKYMCKQFIRNNMSIMGGNLSFLFNKYNAKAIDVLPDAIIGSRDLASIDKQCTLDAIRDLMGGDITGFTRVDTLYFFEL